MHTLNLGVGKKNIDGAIGVDIVATPECDVIANLDGASLPFAANSISTVYAYHVLEHINNLIPLMEEIHRICKEGALIHIEVPYFTCIGAFGDPTHVRFFTYHTFRFWEKTTDQANWFSMARFTIVRRRIVFGKLHRLLGIQFLANKFPHIYENFFPYLFPARYLEITLEA
jgi:hypothetical protein